MWYIIVWGVAGRYDREAADAGKAYLGYLFSDCSGGEPVREWLKSLEPIADRKQIGTDIQTVEFGWPVGMPVCRPLGDSIYEVRSSLNQNRISRVLFYIDAVDRMVLLHAFIKKTQETPSQELELARRNKALHEAEIRKRR